MKPNIRYIDVAEMLLAKRHAEADRLTRQQQDQASDTLAWVLALCVAITMVLVVVSVQEGWW